MNESEKQTILHKELDLIQGCINRMAQNSFAIKGWYFALVIVVSAWKFNNLFFYSGSLIALSSIFYILNLQFYIYELRFRDIYSKRLNLRCELNDYKTELYSLKLEEEKLKFKVLLDKYILRNKMLMFMYFGIALLLIISNIILNIGNDSVDKPKVDNLKIEVNVFD